MDFRHAGINLEDIRSGKQTAIAGALNLLENRKPDASGLAAELIDALTRIARPRRHVIGITGPPGAGKSTLISRLIREYRSMGHAVGIMAVDPSSRRSGGALLGDRARMAAGRHLGGLSWRTRHCLTLFEAAYDRILIETTGVGQSETEIEQVADSVVYVVQPGSGDSLQFMKAGIMEIPHILVVNKSDLKNSALKAFHELQGVAGLSGPRADGWVPVLILVSALEGWGQDQLVSALEAHYRFLSAGDLEKRRRGHRTQWTYLLFLERFGSHGAERIGGEERIFERLEDLDVSNPFSALHELAQDLDRT
jgi:LAO/AO transport system kinase